MNQTKTHIITNAVFPYLTFVGLFLISLVSLFSFSNNSASAMPMGNLTCDLIGGSGIRLVVTGESGWGGLNAGIRQTPAPSGDTEVNLEGDVYYGTDEASAGSTFFIMSNLTPNTMYTFDLELSDTTVIDSVSCTTSLVAPAIDTNLELYSINGTPVNNDNNYYSNATVLSPGDDLVYRYYATNIGPSAMTMSPNNGTDPVTTEDFGMSITYNGSSSTFDRYISGDTNTNNDLDPGETWILEFDIDNVAQSDEAEDSTDLLNDANPDTLLVSTNFLFFLQTIKHIQYEFAQVVVNGCTDSNAHNYNPSADTDDGSCVYADLALRKTTTASSVDPGDDVTFTIDIFNQADVDAYNIEITDYIPSGLSLSTNDTNGWTLSGSVATLTIPGPLASGNNTSVEIVLTVQDPWELESGTVLNYAEISSAEDVSSNSLNDQDSTADNNDSNDCGAEVNSANDDRLDGNAVSGSGCDEDDHDVEDITITGVSLADTGVSGLSILLTGVVFVLLTMYIREITSKTKAIYSKSSQQNKKMFTLFNKLKDFTNNVVNIRKDKKKLDRNITLHDLSSTDSPNIIRKEHHVKQSKVEKPTVDRARMINGPFTSTRPLNIKLQKRMIR